MGNVPVGMLGMEKKQRGCRKEEQERLVGWTKMNNGLQLGFHSLWISVFPVGTGAFLCYHLEISNN